MEKNLQNNITHFFDITKLQQPTTNFSANPNDSDVLNVLSNYNPNKNKTLVKKILIKLLTDNSLKVSQTEIIATLGNLAKHPDIDREIFILCNTCLIYFSDDLQKKHQLVKKLVAINEVNCKARRPWLLAKTCLSFLENPSSHMNPKEFVLNVDMEEENIEQHKTGKYTNELVYFTVVLTSVSQYPDLAEKYLNVLLKYLTTNADEYQCISIHPTYNFISLIKARPDLADNLMQVLLIKIPPIAEIIDYRLLLRDYLEIATCIIEVRPDLAKKFIETFVLLFNKKNIAPSDAIKIITILLKAEPKFFFQLYALIKPQIVYFVDLFKSDISWFKESKFTAKLTECQLIFEITLIIVENEPKYIETIKEQIQPFIAQVIRGITDGTTHEYQLLSTFVELFVTVDPSCAQRITSELMGSLDPIDEEYIYIYEYEYEERLYAIISTLCVLARMEPKIAENDFITMLLNYENKESLMSNYQFLKRFEIFCSNSNIELNKDLLSVLELLIKKAPRDLYRLNIFPGRNINFPFFSKVKPELFSQYINIIRQWFISTMAYMRDFYKINLLIETYPNFAESFIDFQDIKIKESHSEKSDFFSFKCIPSIIKVRPDLTAKCVESIDRMSKSFYYMPDIKYHFTAVTKAILNIDRNYSTKVWQWLLSIGTMLENSEPYLDRVILEIIDDLPLDKIMITDEEKIELLANQNFSEIISKRINQSDSTQSTSKDNKIDNTTFFGTPSTEKKPDTSDSNDEIKPSIQNQP